MLVSRNSTWRLLLKKQNILNPSIRCSSDNKNIKINPNFYNRNPRNLEMMCLQKRDTGWGTKQGDNFEVEVDNLALHVPQRNYYNTMKVYQSKYIHVDVEHYMGNVVLSASTSEWYISEQLHRGYGVSAAISLAHVIGRRCLCAGINSVHWGMPEHITEHSTILQEFKKALVESGVDVKEPPVKNIEYKIHRRPAPHEKYNIE